MVSSWRERPSDTLETAVARVEAQRLARAVTATTTELEANRAALARLVESMAPGLLDVPGVRPTAPKTLQTRYETVAG